MFNVQLFNVQCSMFNVQCSMFNVQCSMFNVQCSMFNVQCSMFNVQCSMFNVQCSMFNVQCECECHVVLCCFCFWFCRVVLCSVVFSSLPFSFSMLCYVMVWCFMFCVLCSVFYGLCSVFYVLCSVFCVLCSVLFCAVLTRCMYMCMCIPEHQIYLVMLSRCHANSAACLPSYLIVCNSMLRMRLRLSKRTPAVYVLRFFVCFFCNVLRKITRPRRCVCHCETSTLIFAMLRTFALSMQFYNGVAIFTA